LIEIKHDGFRIIARKSGGQLRLYRGSIAVPANDFTRRFPLIAEALGRLRSLSCIIITEWLSKKCRPLSKKKQVKPPFPGDAGADEPVPVDQSTLAVAAPRRYRNKAHLRYVAQQACLLCGRKPSDPHHLRHLQPRALVRKASDEFAVPLCRIHHRLVHRIGNEAAWWKDAGIDPAQAARKLWNDSRWIRGGSHLGRRRNVPRQIEPLTSTAWLRTARRQPDLDSADPRAWTSRHESARLRVPVDRPAAVGLRSITSGRFQIRHHRDAIAIAISSSRCSSAKLCGFE
jgi:hypothetical protein